MHKKNTQWSYGRAGLKPRNSRLIDPLNLLFKFNFFYTIFWRKKYYSFSHSVLKLNTFSSIIRWSIRWFINHLILYFIIITHTHTHTHIYIYIYIYAFFCMCVILLYFMFTCVYNIYIYISIKNKHFPYTGVCDIVNKNTYTYIHEETHVLIHIYICI